MKAIHNIEPIYDKNSRVLILGSMPSKVSREHKFFYAHPQNRFWKIFEILFNEKLSTVEKRKNFLTEKNIAIWDVIKSCDIINADDSSIKNIEVNNIDIIINKANIKAIFCTGKKSYQLFKKYFSYNIPVFCLPSTSSANATYNLEKLVLKYKIIKDYL